MKYKKATRALVISQLKKLNFKKFHSPGYFAGRDFYVRVVELIVPYYVDDNLKGIVKKEEKKKIIQLAVKKNFDRWANSVNFEIDFTDTRSEWLNIKEGISKARKIARSGLFDFNCYFDRIKISAY